jgi:hypothetical protein
MSPSRFHCFSIRRNRFIRPICASKEVKPTDAPLHRNLTGYILELSEERQLAREIAELELLSRKLRVQIPDLPLKK